MIRGGLASSEGQQSILADTTMLEYTVVDLAPHTQYWFQVAGVNELGTGRFSDPSVPVTTLEDGMTKVCPLSVLVKTRCYYD